MSEADQNASEQIDLNEDGQVSYWTRELGVTELELRAAIGKVGLSADKVRKFVNSGK